MGNSILTHEDILNLNFNFETFLIDRNSNEFKKHLEFISNYSGRHEKNYTLYGLMHSLENENRFNIGAVKILINNILVRTLLVEKYKNWILLSRLISHDYPRYPLLTSLGEKLIIEIAEQNNSDGVFSTVNTTNRMYVNCVDTEKFRMFNDSSIPLYKKHLSVITNISKLNKTVMFKNTEQFVLYRKLKNSSVEDVFK